MSDTDTDVGRDAIDPHWYALVSRLPQLQQDINDAGLGDPREAEIESLRIQLGKATDSSEHWYRLWTQQGQEIERLRDEVTRRRLERRVVEQDLAEALRLDPTNDMRAICDLLCHALEQVQQP